MMATVAKSRIPQRIPGYKWTTEKVALVSPVAETASTVAFTAKAQSRTVRSAAKPAAKKAALVPRPVAKTVPTVAFMSNSPRWPVSSAEKPAARKAALVPRPVAKTVPAIAFTAKTQSRTVRSAEKPGVKKAALVPRPVAKTAPTVAFQNPSKIPRWIVGRSATSTAVPAAEPNTLTNARKSKIPRRVTVRSDQHSATDQVAQVPLPPVQDQVIAEVVVGAKRLSKRHRPLHQKPLTLESKGRILYGCKHTYRDHDRNPNVTLRCNRFRRSHNMNRCRGYLAE